MIEPVVVARTVVLAMSINAAGDALALPYDPPRSSDAAIHDIGLPRGLPQQRLLQGPSVLKVHDIPQANATLSLVILAERRFSERVDRCAPTAPVGEFNGCVSDALDQFATELAAPEVDLPLQLREVPSHISRAAGEVRAAPAPRRQQARPAPPPPSGPVTAQPAPAPAAPAEDAADRRAAIERAREAVTYAVVEIRKDIQLLEQTEETAVVQELQTRTGDIIAASLERLDDRLLQAVEI